MELYQRGCLVVEFIRPRSTGKFKLAEGERKYTQATYSKREFKEPKAAYNFAYNRVRDLVVPIVESPSGMQVNKWRVLLASPRADKYIRSLFDAAAPKPTKKAIATSSQAQQSGPFTYKASRHIKIS